MTLPALPIGTTGVMAGPVPLAVVVILVVMAVATVTDLRERRVPWWLTVSAIFFGLFVASGIGGPWGAQMRQSVIGLVVGLLLLAPFIWLRGMGGGDAMILGVVGVWFGWAFVLWAMWWASLAGGVLAVIALIRRRREIAYVPALAIGSVVALLVPPFGA